MRGTDNIKSCEKRGVKMIKAHKGYLQADGRFISLDSLLVKIPTDKPITILWDEEIIEPKIQSEEERIKERLAMVESLKGCMAGYDIDLKQIREERLKKKGLL
jgi:hypothetical protein